ncbi:hypothetical protein [Methylobacterium oryzihabitans]|uniref:Uncharacterized protein n=1 Tax=Methylobacterium oryzihabitans TaxID=2499852 RepID=A0A437NZZ5_9HYPH|nr:hypothetical protein [Methylobacterium oryzihabitans]RVU15590.1 hypothetical protein EOE48_18930 [Methylobacterium oryzihabitans]
MSDCGTAVPERDGEDGEAGTTGRALVALAPDVPPGPVPARPLATFLVQLIDGPTGTLRPSRRRRTREAAARYATGASR